MKGPSHVQTSNTVRASNLRRDKTLVVPSLLLLLLLATAKEPTHGTTHTLTPFHHCSADTLAALEHTGANLLAALGNGVDHCARRPAYVAAVLAFALALGAVDAFLGKGVTDGLEEAVLANLASDEVVHTVLELIDLLHAGDFALVESV